MRARAPFRVAMAWFVMGMVPGFCFGVGNAEWARALLDRIAP